MRRLLVRTRAGEERGQVLVLMAFALPVLILIAALVIDVGNWIENRRYAQLQSNAAVFAASARFQRCISLDPVPPGGASDQIADLARAYGGDPDYAPDPAPDPMDPDPPGVFNVRGDGSGQKADVQVNGDPCGERRLQVTVTESDVPVFFSGFVGFSSLDVKRAATAELQTVLSESDVRPIAVRDDPTYGCAEALLVNTESGATTQTVPLAKQAPPPGSGYAEFKSDPTDVDFGPGNVSVRIRLACGGDDQTYAQNPDEVPVGGVNFINTYSTGAAPLPVVRSVRLEGGGCKPNVYFFTNSCFVTAKADVEFQDGAIKGGDDPNVFIWIKNMPADFQGGDTWSVGSTVSAQSGPQEYDVRWEQRFGSVNGQPCGNGVFPNPDPCEGTFGVQQQAYAATDDDTALPSNSGDLILVNIDEPANPGGDAHSFPKNPSRTLVFTVRVRTLANSKPGDDPIVLRFPPNGSRRTGTIICGPLNTGSGAFEYVLTGCPRSIATWTAGSDCVTVNDSAPPTPITCVEAIHPGDMVTAIKQRVGESCNRWNALRDSGTPIPPSDPRALAIVVAPPNANLSGSTPAGTFWQVRKLGTFYVTGWAGGAGSGTGCQNEPFDGSQAYAVWGRWIKYVVPSSAGVGRMTPYAERLCQFEQFGNCIPVLTR